MFAVALTWLIVVWGALSCIYMLHRAWARFPQRDATDVVPFLYPVDLGLAESLVDPATEFDYRWRLSPVELREAQRKRMRLFLEVTRRMAHNSKVLVEYAIAEKTSHDPRRAELAADLQRRAIEVRLYALLAGLRLRFCLMFRLAPFPSIPALPPLRVLAEIDGLESYASLKSAAASFVKLPPEGLESLTRSL